MKCNEAEKLILLQDSGEIAAKQGNVLTTHLHDCQSCQQFQQMVAESKDVFQASDEPGAKVMQDILREARLNVPQKKPIPLFGWKPAVAMAASVMIGLGIFFSVLYPGRVGIEMVVTETELLDAEDQMVSVMYSGLSEDDLAFNFLMTYEEG